MIPTWLRQQRRPDRRKGIGRRSVRVAVLAVVGLAACSRRAAPPHLGQVPEFVLTDQRNQEFRSATLAGKVWVADFIYTTCQGPCPRMSAQMRQVQELTRDLPDLRLLSFTVDPEHDTPEALAAYGKRYHADPERWIFLTGAGETLHELSRDAFKLGDVSGKLEHSTRFVLVDRKFRIRGYYRTWESDAIPNLVADIRSVYKEP